MNKVLKQYTLWTYGAFWAFLLFIGFVLMVLKLEPLAKVLMIVSAWTPTFVFMAMFRRIYPKDTLKDYVKRQFTEPLRAPTVLALIVVQFLIFLGSVLYTSAAQRVPVNTLVLTSWTSLLIVFGDMMIRGTLGEELGWRAFLLTEVQKKYSALKSAVIVGVIWGFWHAPLWFISSSYTGVELLWYIICFLLTITALSIIMTAFYNLNRNLVIPIIAHQLFNFLFIIQTTDALSTMVLNTVFYGIAAVALILVNYKECLYPRRPGHPKGVTR